MSDTLREQVVQGLGDNEEYSHAYLTDASFHHGVNVGVKLAIGVVLGVVADEIKAMKWADPPSFSAAVWNGALDDAVEKIESLRAVPE